MIDAAQYIESSLREQVLEHIFIADLLRCLWRNRIYSVEILRGEVDRGGYDLVVECDGIVRHIQFKASHGKAKTSRVNINTNLAAKPSGCVIWILFDSDTMELGPFLWFGGDPGQPMPSLGDRVARHSKANASGFKADRPNSRILNRGQFTPLPDMESVVTVLLGVRFTGASIEEPGGPTQEMPT